MELEGAAASVGSLIAARLGCILGKTFQLDPKCAKRLSE